MPGLLGKKIGMTSVFSADGKNVPCTVIEAGPCVVTQIKSVEKDGYAAVQVGFQDKKEKISQYFFLIKMVMVIMMFLVDFKNLFVEVMLMLHYTILLD